MRQDVATRAWAKSPQKRGSPPFSHFVAPAAGRWPAIESELHCALEPLARARRRRRQRPWRCSWRRLSPARGGARCRAHRDRTEREPLARRAEAPISTNADLRSSKPLARARRRLVNILARTIQVSRARPNAHEAEPRNLPQPRRQRRCFSRISASRMAASITDERRPAPGAMGVAPLPAERATDVAPFRTRLGTTTLAHPIGISAEWMRGSYRAGAKKPPRGAANLHVLMLPSMQ